MHDNQRSIEGQSILRAMGDILHGQGPQNKDTLSDLFDSLAVKLDAYASVSDAPQNALGQHLSDEKVAQRLPPLSSYATPQIDNLKMITGSVEATSSKKTGSGKDMYGIKLLGDWYTSFWKAHFDAAESAKLGGHQIKMLFETKAYKDKKTGEMKMGKNVQSVELA